MRHFFCYLIQFFSLIPLLSIGQSNVNVCLDWGQSKILSLDNKKIEVLTFENSHYNLSEHSLPIYKKKIRLPENTSNVEVNVNVLDQSEITFNEKQVLNLALKSSWTPDDFLTWEISYERKIPYLILSYIPINKEFKVNCFSYTLNLTYKEYDIESKSVVFNSVLAEGDWYKIKVNDDGLYKIDKSFLEDIGLDVSSIDPRKIQIYGNGGAMLPESNADFRFEDLVQNSIYLHGEDDGSFDTNDFLVFYGESPHRWNFIDSNFYHVQNIYDNSNFYYLHIAEEFGLRVQKEQILVDATLEKDYYTDFIFYEWENKNLVNSGRQWFGEYFSFNNQYSINFNFSNRIFSEPIKINARAVAQSSSSSSLEFSHNGNNILTIPFSSSSNYDDGENFSLFQSSSSTIGINVSFDRNGNTSAFAYLDYIELQAKCALNYNGGHYLFREPSTIGQDNVTKFNINSTSSSIVVWDVTNPTEIKSLEMIENFSFIAETDSLKTFALHDLNKSSYNNPSFVEKVENQNLHAQDAANLIIITAPSFLEAAERLAELHRQEDDISVVVATTDQIYNEFSSGKQDLVALRSFIRMFYDKADTEDEIPDNVLLFGDASFDYKGIGPANNSYTEQNFVPTYQSEYSFKLGPSYCTDDFLTFLDASEGDNMNSDGMDIGIGRMVVQSLSQAHAMVDKIENYYSINSFGDWRSNICFVADDIDDESWEYRLQEDIDEIAQNIDTNYHNYNINKIYLDTYQQESSSGGQRYPGARQAIIDNVNKGVLIMHYYGHGGEVGWAEERVLGLTDINAWENMDNLPVFVTATCEFSRYDDAERISAGEQVFLNPKGAGIALFTTTRTISANDAKSLSETFYRYAIPETAGDILTFGEIMKGLKNDLNLSGVYANKSRFTLLGDPALKLPIPYLDVVVTEVLNLNTNQIDTIQALSKVRVKGAVLSKDGFIQDSFNGFLKPKVYDKPLQIQTLNNDHENLEPFYFDLQQSILHSGNVSVENGLFEFEFIAPQDINFAVGFGKFSFYAYSDTDDAIGSYVDVVIGGFDANADQDEEGPIVELFLNHSDFRYGGITDSNPSLYAIISDDSGINTTGNGIGHDIVATIDENSQTSVVLNNYYESNIDSYQSGVLIYPYSNIEEGPHQLKLKVWDIHNNSTEAFTEFVVVSDGGLVLENMMNYPNPFSDFTRIHFEHNRSDEDLSVQLEIYDISGKLVRTINNSISQSSYANSDFVWDGSSDDGAYVISGIYIAKLIVSTKNFSEQEIIRNQMILIK